MNRGAVLSFALWALAATSARAQARLEYVTSFGGTETRQFSLGGAHAVAVSPDGRHVYVASFDDNAVVVLLRDRALGTLEFTEAHVDRTAGVQGVFRPVSVVVSPDGNHVYVGAFFGDAVAVFSRDSDSGRLSFIEALFGGTFGYRGLTQVHGLAVAPDGSQVFVASYGNNALTVLRRDPGSGRLTPEQLWLDENEGGSVSGLVRPTAVAASPDGRHVFVTSGGSSSLVHFRRDPHTGELAPGETFFDGGSPALALEGAIAVSVSPDGRDVYALAMNGVTHFRIGEDAALTFADVLAGPAVIGAGEAAGPTDITVVPQGSAVVLTRGGDDTVVLLERMPRTGSLRFVQSISTDEEEFVTLAGAAAVAVEPSGRWVYVALQFGDGVAVLRRWPSCAADCNEDGSVTVDELVTAVNALLSDRPQPGCWQADRDGDNRITVDEVVFGVRMALFGCVEAANEPSL